MGLAVGGLAACREFTEHQCVAELADVALLADHCTITHRAPVGALFVSALAC